MDSRVKNLWGVATQEPTTVVYTTHTQHNQQQHCNVRMETSSNTYRSLLSDIKSNYKLQKHLYLREHQQKNFVTLSGFWPLRRGEFE